MFCSLNWAKNCVGFEATNAQVMSTCFLASRPNKRLLTGTALGSVKQNLERIPPLWRASQGFFCFPVFFLSVFQSSALMKHISCIISHVGVFKRIKRTLQPSEAWLLISLSKFAALTCLYGVFADLIYVCEGEHRVVIISLINIIKSQQDEDTFSSFRRCSLKSVRTSVASFLVQCFEDTKLWENKRFLQCLNVGSRFFFNSTTLQVILLLWGKIVVAFLAKTNKITIYVILFIMWITFPYHDTPPTVFYSSLFFQKEKQLLWLY